MQFDSIASWLQIAGLSIAFNIVAAYLKPVVDRFGSWASSRWAERNAKVAQDRSARLALLKSDEKARLAASFNELRHLLEGSLIGVFSIAVLLMGFIGRVRYGSGGFEVNGVWFLRPSKFWFWVSHFLIALGLCGMIWAVDKYLDALTMRREVEEATKSLAE